MAGTVTITETVHETVQRIKFEWTCTAGGAADGATTKSYSGELCQAVFIPGGGASSPTDQYDITITDSDGVDVLHGEGVNRSNLSTEYRERDFLGSVASSKLTLNVTNAGNAKGGTVVIDLR